MVAPLLLVALAVGLGGCAGSPADPRTGPDTPGAAQETTPEAPSASPTDSASVVEAHLVPFPDIDPAGLDGPHAALLAILKQELATKPEGTKYSEGVDEPWCADFVSWALNEAGMPLTNPNTGAWRIPGIFTMRDYFESVGAWHDPGDGYTPVFGDVVIYEDGSPVWGGHSQLVLMIFDGNLVTIGGNQVGGPISVASFPLDYPNLSIWGFGATS